MQTMTHGNESSAATGDLLVAFELSQRWWKVGFTTGMGHRVRTRRIAAGALESVAEAIADGSRMFGHDHAIIHSCSSPTASGSVLESTLARAVSRGRRSRPPDRRRGRSLA